MVRHPPFDKASPRLSPRLAPAVVEVVVDPDALIVPPTINPFQVYQLGVSELRKLLGQ